MPHRTTPVDNNFLNYHQTTRATVNEVENDDGNLMQQVSADMFHSDSRQRIEAPQNYGFTSVTLPRDQSDKKQNTKDGVGQKGPAAEAVIVHPSGSRGHPVAVVIDDRRYRPRELPPGGSMQYDQNGQGTYIHPDQGTYVMALDSDGKSRAVSLRHVTKPKQPAPSKDKKSGKVKKSNYKHEGETVNAEIKITKDSIQFLVGGVVLGEVTSEGFVIGGQMSDVRRRKVFRRTDIDDAGNTPVTNAEKGFAI